MILKELEKLRFPMKFELLDNINKNKKDILKKYGVKVNFPEDLEGDRLSINIDFKSSADLSDKSEKLLKLSSDNSLSEIFRVLSGDY